MGATVQSWQNCHFQSLAVIPGIQSGTFAPGLGWGCTIGGRVDINCCVFRLACGEGGVMTPQVGLGEVGYVPGLRVWGDCASYTAKWGDAQPSGEPQAGETETQTPAP